MRRLNRGWDTGVCGSKQDTVVENNGTIEEFARSHTSQSRRYQRRWSSVEMEDEGGVTEEKLDDDGVRVYIVLFADCIK